MHGSNSFSDIFVGKVLAVKAFVGAGRVGVSSAAGRFLVDRTVAGELGSFGFGPGFFLGAGVAGFATGIGDESRRSAADARRSLLGSSRRVGDASLILSTHLLSAYYHVLLPLAGRSSPEAKCKFALQ